jgi:hypothetical protein
MKFMPMEANLMPIVQSIWYWPQDIDIWGQTKLEGWSGDTTDTILGLIDLLKLNGTPCYPTPADWSAYPPAQRYYTADARPLMETLALATSKTQDNPHHHKIVCAALEEYELSMSPQKDEFLLMASAYLSAARSMRDCYELYTKYFPG